MYTGITTTKGETLLNSLNPEDSTSNEHQEIIQVNHSAMRNIISPERVRKLERTLHYAFKNVPYVDRVRNSDMFPDEPKRYVWVYVFSKDKKVVPCQAVLE